jgi:site-specific recombinase XerD
MANNTINTSFKYLRRIITQAFKEKLIKENPFDSYDIPRYRQTDRIYLTKDELATLVEYAEQLTGSLRVTGYFFLLGCYSGLRHSDWQRFNYQNMVHDGFIRIRAKKNKKHVVLPIGLTLSKILDVVKELPPPASNQKCNVMLKAIADAAGIKKPLTTHAARHSFGYLCASNKIPKSVTAELMGINTHTVEVYYHLAGENIIQQAAVLKTL